jgi:hypothetical protein
MVPDMVLALDYLPLATISGKADSKLLRQTFFETPLDDLLGRKSQKQRPLTETESVVCNTLLSVSGSGLEVNYNTTTLELGIDSLATITLSARLVAAGFDVSVPFLLRGPSIAEISKRIALSPEQSPQSKASQGVKKPFKALKKKLLSGSHVIPTQEIEAVLPTLPLQEGLVAQSLDTPTPLYINHVILRLRPEQAERIVNSFNATIVANEILRTRFAILDNEIVQVVLAPHSYPSPWIEERRSSTGNMLAEIRPSLDDLAHDISTKLLILPPLRLSMWSDAKEHIFVVSLHHSIYDGMVLVT